MKLHFLGTGHGTATNCYNACFVIENEKNEYFLVDSGGGNTLLVNLEKLNIPVEKIYNIFVSHTHIDHILGVIWYIRKIAKYYREDLNRKVAYIYGNDEVIKAIRTICDAILPQSITKLLDTNIILKEVTNEEIANIISYDVTFFDTTARKVKQYGFYLQDTKNNIKLSFLGDEYCKEESEKYIANSDILVADGYMCGKEADEYDPITRHSHSSVKHSATIANRCNVKNLILFHTIDTDMENRKRTFTQDAKLYFNGNVFVPEDLETIEF